MWHMPVAIPAGLVTTMQDVVDICLAHSHEFRGEWGVATNAVALDGFYGGWAWPWSGWLIAREKHGAMVKPVFCVKQQSGQFAVLRDMAVLACGPVCM